MQELRLPHLSWIDPEPLPSDFPPLHPDPLLTELLYRRRIRDPEAAFDFLNGGRRPPPNPHRLPTMEQAVNRVARAIETDERIAIYGDYDVDGVTATAILVRALRTATGDETRVFYRLPTRREGYGLNPAAIDELAAAGASLLIAVDCGSTDHVNTAYARSQGLDLVILDHHHMEGPGPKGAIVVSAQQNADGPYRELAAVGVAYLLVVALAQHGCLSHRDDGGNPETDLLDFVALGTIGDVAPLTGVNRALVRDGLRRIRQRPRPGIEALCRHAGIDPATLSADQVAFKVAPRLNAAGRMSDPSLALQVLLTDEHREAIRLGEEIETLNQFRRAESQRIVTEAEQLLHARPDWISRRLLVIAGQGWSGGVLGIAASQLAERHGRPVIVLNDDGVISRGSARSVPGFDIIAALARNADLLHQHGGHSQAAGLAISTADLPHLELALESALAASDLPIPFAPSLRIDADLPAHRLTLETARLLESLEPYGADNEQPLFRLRGLRVRAYDAIGRDKSHLKVILATGRGTVRTVCWGAAVRSRELLAQPLIDAIATLAIDHWNDQPRLDVELKDFRVAEERTA
jgi:single-stranded-DNA-specific exonuclease